MTGLMNVNCHLQYQKLSEDSRRIASQHISPAHLEAISTLRFNHPALPAIDRLLKN